MPRGLAVVFVTVLRRWLAGLLRLFALQRVFLFIIMIAGVENWRVLLVGGTQEGAILRHRGRYIFA